MIISTSKKILQDIVIIYYIVLLYVFFCLLIYSARKLLECLKFNVMFFDPFSYLENSSIMVEQHGNFRSKKNLCTHL